MDDYILRQEHEEFEKRLDAENARQNRRLSMLEENIKEIHGLTVSVERMAVNMENMLSAIERQGNLIEEQNNRIDKIEKEPAKDYRQIKTAVITAVILAIAEAAAIAVIALL